jgi:glycosyltransferase involved in cell wall biosynthesis
VRFTGALNQTEVRAWYARADAFALASFAEGIPVVLMEAMASAIPCVSTRITGIPELIRDGEDGLLVTPSDTDELAAALARLMDDAPLRHYLGRSGRARVQQKYNLVRNVERLGGVFATRLGAQA